MYPSVTIHGYINVHQSSPAVCLTTRYHAIVPPRKVSMRSISLAILFLAAFVLASCSSNKPAEQSSAPAAEQKKSQPNEYVTGQKAFQNLYVAARSFSPDVKPYRLQSLYTPDAPVAEGKAGIWSAQFASTARRGIKSYTWSGISAEGAPDRGVTHGTEDTYSPSNTSTQVFEPAFLKIDSSKAFDEAQKHGGDKLFKKDPKQPVIFVLDWNPKGNELIWHVIYGTSRNDAKLAIAIDASSGLFKHIEH
jgi:hypothetical protein